MAIIHRIEMEYIDAFMVDDSIILTVVAAIVEERPGPQGSLLQSDI